MTARNRAAPVAAVLLALLLGGCAALGPVIELSGRLNDDGFAESNVSANAGPQGDLLTITASGHRTLSGQAAPQRAAEIAWRTFPQRIDRLDASVAGSSLSAGRDQLTAAFGPRDPALDATTTGDQIASGVRDAVVVIAIVALVVIVGVVVLAVVLVRRSRRRRGPPGPPYPPRA